MAECSSLDSCKRNLEPTENFIEGYGQVYICKNCKRYYVWLNEERIAEAIYYKHGEWKVLYK